MVTTIKTDCNLNTVSLSWVQNGSCKDSLLTSFRKTLLVTIKLKFFPTLVVFWATGLAPPPHIPCSGIYDNIHVLVWLCSLMEASTGWFSLQWVLRRAVWFGLVPVRWCWCQPHSNGISQILSTWERFANMQPARRDRNARLGTLWWSSAHTCLATRGVTTHWQACGTHTLP